MDSYLCKRHQLWYQAVSLLEIVLNPLDAVLLGEGLSRLVQAALEVACEPSESTNTVSGEVGGGPEEDTNGAHLT